MANPRQEIIFQIGGQEHRARATFEKIAQLEQRFTAVFPLMLRLEGGHFGMHELCDALQIILGTPKQGGPQIETLRDAIFDNYADLLIPFSKYVASAVNDPNAPASNPLKKTG